MIIVSTLARSWPAHGISIVVGRNVIDDGDASRKALLERLFTPFIEARQFVVEPETPTAKETT